MAKLNPPYIEGSLPAFYGTVLSVPFSMNKTVANADIQSEKNGPPFIVKLKTIQSNTLIDCGIKCIGCDWTNQIATFNISNANKLIVGQYYKLQMAYLSSIDGTPGYYSTIGIIKYTTEPNVYIENYADTTGLHSIVDECIGVYSQNGQDSTEKVYSYRFDLFDENKNIFETSGELLHDSSSDDSPYESIDRYRFHKTLEENKTYTVSYTITTTNKLVKSSPDYTIISQTQMPPDIDALLIIESNYDDGYVQLSMRPGISGETLVSGNFILSRASSVDNYSQWDDVNKFFLNHDSITIPDLWKDFTVQQGVSYKYSLQQYNNSKPPIYSQRIISSSKDVNGVLTEGLPIYVDFEDAFLFDGKRQLKIRYNPKMTSFKLDVLENKMDTIGSKHPFIFRNGNVAYKEFPLSGLISYQMDDNHFFVSEKDLGLSSEWDRERPTSRYDIPAPGNEPHRDDVDKFGFLRYPATLEGTELFNRDHQKWVKAKQKYDDNQAQITKRRIFNKDFADNYRPKTNNLVNYNIAAERFFKLEVLEWLNDGNPKLFKSPTEGNYIVRLMNTSLAPTDGLGRMLHTFTSTAYEVADYNYENMANYNFINMAPPSTTQYYWESNDLTTDKNVSDNLLLHAPATNVMIMDCLPGETFTIQIQNSDGSLNSYDIMIGQTGSYYIENEQVQSIVYTNVAKKREVEILHEQRSSELSALTAEYEVAKDEIENNESLTPEESATQLGQLANEYEPKIQTLMTIVSELEAQKAEQEQEEEIPFHQGIITYSYMSSTISSSFDKIEKITSQNLFYTIPYGELLERGTSTDHSNDKWLIGQTYVMDHPEYYTHGLMDYIAHYTDIKTKFSKFYFINFKRRPTYNIYIDYPGTWDKVESTIESMLLDGNSLADTSVDNTFFHFWVRNVPKKKTFMPNTSPYYYENTTYYVLEEKFIEGVGTRDSYYSNFNEFINALNLHSAGMILPYEQVNNDFQIVFPSIQYAETARTYYQNILDTWIMTAAQQNELEGYLHQIETWLINHEDEGYQMDPEGIYWLRSLQIGHTITNKEDYENYIWNSLWIDTSFTATDIIDAKWWQVDSEGQVKTAEEPDFFVCVDYTDGQRIQPAGWPTDMPGPDQPQDPYDSFGMYNSDAYVYHLSRLDNIYGIFIGSGIQMDCGYQIFIRDYKDENNIQNIQLAKTAYNNASEAFAKALANKNTTERERKLLLCDKQAKYKNFIEILAQEVEE